MKRNPYEKPFDQLSLPDLEELKAQSFEDRLNNPSSRVVYNEVMAEIHRREAQKINQQTYKRAKVVLIVSILSLVVAVVGLGLRFFGR